MENKREIGINLDLTYKEAMVMCRWTRRQRFNQQRIRPYVAIPLAQRGLVSIEGWYAHGDITWGETPPDHVTIVRVGTLPNGRPNLKPWTRHMDHGVFAGKEGVDESIHAVCQITELGKLFVDKYGTDWLSRMTPNRKGIDPVIQVRT